LLKCIGFFQNYVKGGPDPELPGKLDSEQICSSRFTTLLADVTGDTFVIESLRTLSRDGAEALA
jgi:hypothetical protein